MSLITTSYIATEDPSTSKPRYRVQSLDDSYEVYGVDAIWYNQYAGPESDFICIRGQFDCDINALVMKVSGHVADGHYTVISMNATLHMLTVFCVCLKMQADLPEDMWHDPPI